MPIYRFVIHGTGIQNHRGHAGFVTTRWAQAATEQQAAEKALDSVRRNWTTGPSSVLNDGPPPTLEIDSSQRIAAWEIWSASNRGNTLYRDEDLA
ncbi:hypothetical protein [Devosia sp.]|uniref:hypothetical protein n=1 Tax=Devosia sp. TaxID=1871048 RepID=UPI002FCAD5EB